MHDSRVNYTATLLNNGKVLVAGGESAAPAGITTLSSAELYDPTTGTFIAGTRRLHGARTDRPHESVDACICLDVFSP